MTIHEKSAWASVVAILVLYIPYFSAVNAQPMEGVYRFWGVTIGMAVIMGVFHAIDAIVHVIRHRTHVVTLVDELDQAIQRDAAMVAGGVLAGVVVCWVIGMMYALPLSAVTVTETTSDGIRTYVAWSVDDIMRAIHWLFAGFVMANLVYYFVMIVRYRSMLNAH